jgi:simple sugar transport system substrate-binding protein
VTRVLDLLNAEFAPAMTLAGFPRPSDVTPDLPRKERPMKRIVISHIALCVVVLFVACSRDRADDRDSPAPGRGTAASAAKPAPFDKGPVKIALVQYSGAGDYFQQWTKGAQQQADVAGMTMQLYDAKADDARQAADMKTAIASRVAGIIVDHGRSPTMCPLINQATDAGIAVVVYDVKVGDCAPKAVETAQNDSGLAALVLTQMAKDIGDGVAVGYVNPFVIAPLERRDVVWKRFVADHKWDQKFAVGKFSHDVAADNARLAAPALAAHPDVRAVFAPYDELTKGTVAAIDQNKLGSRVAAYGIDISDADIELMTKEGSPWKATATTDPSAIGAGVARTMALELAGRLGSKRVVFPGVLVTQSYLLKQQIKNMADLRAKLPDLNLTKVSAADWLPSVTF